MESGYNSLTWPNEDHLMTDSLSPDEVARLHDLARTLRDGGRLPADAQKALAELLDHLGDALAVPEQPAGTADVAVSTGELLHTLHGQPAPGLLQAARDRLEDAARAAEAEAPVVTGLVRRLIDAIANIGI